MLLCCVCLRSTPGFAPGRVACKFSDFEGVGKGISPKLAKWGVGPLGTYLLS